jgi:tetratricopeptide (TPR) repeat protein
MTVTNTPGRARRLPGPFRRWVVLAAVVGTLLPAAAPAAPDFSELVRRGFTELGAGQFEEAAADLQEALQAQPDSEPARKGLAKAWVGLAGASLQAGRLPQSRDSLEKAVALLPDAADYRLMLARVCFRQNDVEAARAAVDEALERAPDSGPARELSGDLYDRAGELNLAVGEWEAALKAGASPRLAAKIERARREMAVEQGMERESSRHFAVLYDRDVPRDLVKSIFELLDKAFDVLHDRLGEYPRGEIAVLLYGKVAFSDVTRSPDWVGGLYDGKIRIPVGGLTTAEEAVSLYNVIVHEMTHAFLFRAAPEGLPRWFHEGLATSFQGWDPARIRAWFSEHPPAGLAGITSLADVDRALTGRGDVNTAYAAARLALQEIEDARGFGAVRGIIAGVGAGRPFAEVFRDEVRMELPEFEDRWRRGLR